MHASLTIKIDDPSQSEEAFHTFRLVPFDRNPHFTGRTTLLARLDGMLFKGDRTTKIAITGLGGIGKTQLALELVYLTWSKHKDCSIIWIPAANMESLNQAYFDAAKQLGVSRCEENKTDVKQLVQDCLSNESAGQWLLVFDGADDVNMWTGNPNEDSDRLIEYLPKSKQGTIIFTTRDRGTAVKLAQTFIEVPEMDASAAEQLLQRCLLDQNLIDSREDTTNLLVQLTHLPLAIAQAAAYINGNGTTLEEYLSLLAAGEEDVIELLSEEYKDRDARNSVGMTWLRSFDQIRQRNPLAYELLYFLACEGGKEIERSRLPRGPSRKSNVDAMGLLSAYYFIEVKRDFCSLHPLVRLAARSWFRENARVLAGMKEMS
jgi:NB-ARC domain